jgi:hypothetical protein
MSEHEKHAGVAPAIPEEQAMDLRRLQMAASQPNAEVQAFEDAEAAQIAAEQAAQVDQNTASVQMGLDIAIPFLSRLYPSLADIYTDEARGAVAMTVGPVLTKHGVNLGDIGGQYKEEIAMVAVCGPIAMATYAGIKADIAARERQVPKAVASNSQQAAPADEPVTLG